MCHIENAVGLDVWESKRKVNIQKTQTFLQDLCVLQTQPYKNIYRRQLSLKGTSNQLQKQSIASAFVNKVMQQFTDDLQNVRDSLSSLCEEYDGSAQQLKAKKCRTLGRTEGWATPLLPRFVTVSWAIQRKGPTKTNQFPEAALDTTIATYPLLNKRKLKTELSVMYDYNEFRDCSDFLALLQFFTANNLQDTFSETVTLLKILITTPMTTPESQRSSSERARIKNFLSSTKAQDRLNALVMLSMEKNLVKEIPDFNHRVVERFASLEEGMNVSLAPSLSSLPTGVSGLLATAGLVLVAVTRSCAPSSRADTLRLKQEASWISASKIKAL
ncbi:hypothetical protein JOB18_032604 [Solea senegalensis]|uniref:Uncharacterized protein n=1 Tax=Solea senegalensis TaxID=28829 RepID=A0AAV6Q163_SOLSE|nr:hypothetical protein JOB18_032604 [Solea senegalensis]